MRVVLLSVIMALAFPVGAIGASYRDAIEARLAMVKNPELGPPTEADLRAVTHCTNKVLDELEASKSRNLMRALRTTEPGAGQLVAVAIDNCLRDEARGVHVIWMPVND